MYDLLGISHLVFTVNQTKYKDSNYLNEKFYSPEEYIFDHYSNKKTLLRNSSKEFSKINLFKSKDNSLPAFEFLNSKSDLYRPIDSYGIIDKNYKNLKTQSRKIEFLDNNWIFSHYCSELNLNICNDTDLIKNNTGLWFKVNTFEKHVNFFKNHLNLNCLYKDNYKAIFKSRVINKSLTNFEIVILRSNEKQYYFNDDIGFSTIGWVTKNLVQIKNIDHFNVTDEFKIIINNNEFSAQFIYDNTLISNEFLKINYARNKK